MESKYEKNISIWQNNFTGSLKAFPALEGVCSTEVLIIGGGMAGVLTAYELSRRGIQCIIAESYQIGQGNTAGSTAKITSQHGFIYHNLMKEKGSEAAMVYLQAGEKALDAFLRLAGVYECDFERSSNLVYTRRGRTLAEKEMTALDKLGFKALFRDAESLTLPFRTDGAVEFPDQGCFHPLKFLKGITESMTESKSSMVRIFENTWIQRLKSWHGEGWEAVSERGTILADQVVFASHFPFLNRHGAYFMKMYQNKSSVISGSCRRLNEGEHILDGMYADENDLGLSFREVGRKLILVGGGSRTGKDTDGWTALEAAAEDFYLGWKTENRWAAQDCMSLDGLPYVGPYYGTDGSNHGLWVASGFNKWGLTGSMMAAQLLGDLIYGGSTAQNNPLAKLLGPSRPLQGKQLIVNSGESVLHLVKPTAPRCRHLGCALNWNESLQRWECPCHGSLYDKEGRCLEGPSTKNLF